jgi:hypothetical protein
MGGEELRRYQLYLLHERKFALGTVENNNRLCGFFTRRLWLSTLGKVRGCLGKGRS